MDKEKDVIDFIKMLDKKKGFFNNVEEINKYNMTAIIEVIQYHNIKEYGSPLYTKEEIRRGIKKYLTNLSN